MLRGSESANKALVIVTDCRQSDWKLKESELDALKKSFEEAKTLGIKTYLLDVGPSAPREYANRAVIDLKPAEKAVQAGAVTELVATVKNLGPDDAEDVPIKFTVSSPLYGDNVLPTKTIAKIPQHLHESCRFLQKSGPQQIRWTLCPALVNACS